MSTKLTKSMDFGEALAYLKRGGWVSRHVWSDDVLLKIHVSHQVGRISPKSICMKTSGGDTLWWLPTSADIFAEDWIKLDKDRHTN